MDSRQQAGHPTRTAVTGPLAPYANGFREDLAGKGYHPQVIGRHVGLMADLSRWLEDQQLSADALVAEVVQEYLRARRAAGLRDLVSAVAVAPLLGYLRRLAAAPAAEAQVPSAPLDRLLAGFADYLVRERGLSAASVTSYQHHARPFLAGLTPPLDTALAELSAAEVTAFMVNHRGQWGTGTAKATVTALRSLLRFLHATGRAPHSLATAVPSVAGWRLAPLPADVNPDHVAALLASCDRRSAGGRRDYAILMLLSRLGLRAGEVAAIELGDVDWRAGELLVRGKGSRREHLPLPVDVGEALADYVQHGRPRCAGRTLLVILHAPYTGLNRSHVLTVVHRACQRAGLPKFGAHRLRHSVACDLLRKGASLAEVGQVLRHRDERTTAIYAKVDLDALRALARPCPPVGAL
ncbi:site-specific integrase [Nonomuraea sp. NBC_00507]|uniref:site-specific integrase n=1 Tax=Nonomuraea sp. NBC_00507 TaxID=2976002 RepID=UPI002E19244E